MATTPTKTDTVGDAKVVPFPLRKRTGTAAYHLSTAAVGLGLEDLEKLTEHEARMVFAMERWGSETEMPCPHCGTVDTHYWTYAQKRWKCKCCDKRFSVTSQTVFADHKLTLVKMLKIMFTWTNASAGLPALHIRKNWNVSYGTAFTNAHKLREGFVRSIFNGPLVGTNEMDGMDVNGRRYKEKRNKTRAGSTAGKPKVPEYLLKPSAEFVGPPTPPKWGKAAKQPADRRIMILLCQRGVSDGKGSSATRVGIAMSESAKTVTAMAQKYASAESIIMSDEDTSYAKFREYFADHKTINHSVAYSDGKGTSNNQAESANARMRRLLEGTYLAVSTKHIMDYASECAWRVDTRRLSSSEKLRHALRNALSVGLSQWWRGYTHGHHRKTELLIEGDQPALGRGRQEGWKPMYAR